jgi:hypothetical protein
MHNSIVQILTGGTIEMKMRKNIELIAILMVLLAACLFTACDGGTMEELWKDELGNNSGNGGDGPTPPPAPVLTDYTVRYLEDGTEKVLAPEKKVTGKTVGTTVTENAISITGYTALDPTEATLVLAETGNEIIFYYYYEQQPVLTDYVVKYLDKDTNESVAADKVQTDLEVGTSVTESAIPVDGYAALDPTEATLVLAETGNEIIFYYERQPVLTDYVVKYLDKDTNEPVADEKTESGLEVGTSVTETAIPVGGYAALDPTEAPLVLAETGNEIIFYYQKLTTYTIHYCDDMTGEEIAAPKTVTDVPVGETYTEYAISIRGYIALDNEITFTLKENGNDYYLYYMWDNVD